MKVYPIGVPAMYAAILWKKRHLLNPRAHTITISEPDRGEDTATTAEAAGGVGIFIFSRVFRIASRDQTKREFSPQELEVLEQKVRARVEHPELAASMLLWKDFGEGWKSIQFPSSGLGLGSLLLKLNKYVHVPSLCTRDEFS